MPKKKPPAIPATIITDDDGDILNGMDAAEHEDAERSRPIFEAARRLFPIKDKQ